MDSLFDYLRYKSLFCTVGFKETCIFKLEDMGNWNVRYISQFKCLQEVENMWLSQKTINVNFHFQSRIIHSSVPSWLEVFSKGYLKSEMTNMYVMYCNRVILLHKPSPYNMLCKEVVSFSSLHKHLNFKRNRKQVMWVVQKEHHKILCNWLFQIKWISINILHLWKEKKCEDGIGVNGIYSPIYDMYCLAILDFGTLLVKLTKFTLPSKPRVEPFL